MLNHYRTLGITNAASADEIRRAYRILARRYHPDVNPNGNTEALFKDIAHAYSVLSDSEKKQQYDLELKQSAESFHETYERAQEALRHNQRARAYAKQQENSTQASARQTTSNDGNAEPSPSRPANKGATTRRNNASLHQIRKVPSVALARIQQVLGKIPLRLKVPGQRPHETRIGQLALIELSISIQDAIHGSRKAVEIPDNGSHTRKVSVAIPPGVRTGSIVRLRSKTAEREEIVVIIRVEHHPWLSLAERGITMEVPLTIGEAIDGAKIQVPSFGEPLLVTVPPGTQSGKEVRLKGQGLSKRDGTRGDLYIRFVVRIPDVPLPSEVESLTELLADSYSHGVRAHLPKRLGE